MAQQQQFFAYQAEAVATELAQVLSKAAEVVRVYNTRLYGKAGTNEITQADISAGINGQAIKGTPDDLYAAIILLDTTVQFVASSPYKSALDKIRLDY